jgi:hypothetical protein
MKKSFKFRVVEDWEPLFRSDTCFKDLSNEEYGRRRVLDNMVFSLSIERNAYNLVEHLITKSQITVTKRLIQKMIDQDQKQIIKLCLRYKTKFDIGIKQNRLFING